MRKQNQPIMNRAGKSEVITESLERLASLMKYLSENPGVISDCSQKSTDEEYTQCLTETLEAIRTLPRLSGYGMGEEDVRVVSYIYTQLQRDLRMEINARRIIASAGISAKSLTGKFEYLVSLLDREILSFARSQQEDYHYNASVVLESRYVFNSYFLNLLLGKRPIPEAGKYLAGNLAGAAQPMEVVCDYFSILFAYYPELTSDLTETEGYRYGKTMREFISPLLRAIKRLPLKHPLNRFIINRPFSVIDLHSLFLIYYFEERLSRKVELSSIANLLSRNMPEYRFLMRYLSYNSILKLDGLIKAGWRGPYRDNSVELTAKALQEMNLNVSANTEENDEIIAQ